jgi:hypothetical protein
MVHIALLTRKTFAAYCTSLRQAPDLFSGGLFQSGFESARAQNSALEHVAQHLVHLALGILGKQQLLRDKPARSLARIPSLRERSPSGY